jgi:hypothetical protein
MSGEIILYTTDDGAASIQLRAVDGTVWLSQIEMATLFQTTKQNISLHVRNILAEGELTAEATVKEYLTVQTEGDRQVKRTVALYRLEMILAVGFRVRSPRGTQFRRWATGALQEYLVKGFVMDDERLKDPGLDYFDELLARIRDIRSSEKMFYRKVLEIYATSVDYDPSAEASQLFFKTVQNKMHWAAHGHTAAEIVAGRADADKDHMGMTNWQGQAKGRLPRRADAVIAKSYLAGEELEALNRIVTAYLEFAELQAMNRRAMTMGDWIAKLDDFLRLSDRDVLTHAGRVTAEKARLTADREYELWHARVQEEPRAVERHFAEAISQTKALQKGKKRQP